MWAHYTGLLRRYWTWAGVVFLILNAMTIVVPMTANAAGELEPRSTQISTSSPAVGATTSYTFTFRPATTATIEGIGFQLCGSPVSTVACSAVSSSSMSAAAFSTTGQSAPFNASWALGAAGNCGADSATYASIYYATGSSLSNATTYTVTVTGIQNPEAANTQFYTRITTYTGCASGAGTGTTDYGGEALSTGTTINVSALVQESLNFSVGQSDSGTCGTLSGAQVYLGNPANGSSSSVLSSTAASAGSSVGCVATNAKNGYTLYYTGTSIHNNTFTNYSGTTHDFTTSSGGNTITGGISGGANDFFGIGFAAATPASGDIAGGLNVTGASGYVAPTFSGNYGTADEFSYNNAADTQVASETTGPTVATKYTALYEAEAAATTAFGQYEVNLDYLATSSY